MMKMEIFRCHLQIIHLLCRYRYGDIFQIKTGPIRQYWIGDAEGRVAEELMNMKECSGRTQLKVPAFSDEFLFLTRDLERAKVWQNIKIYKQIYCFFIEIKNVI